MGFVVSFGIGSAIVTLILWILRYAYNVGYYYGSCSMAYRELPPFHFRTMALPASMSGILWSIGNLFSMVSVQYLGEGVGYSVIQLGMMVSGLWGICLFQEITGATQICKWFASATFAVGGILFLSYEHHAAANR
jgi:glucose uptake protein GlcU